MSPEDTIHRLLTGHDFVRIIAVPPTPEVGKRWFEMGTDGLAGTSHWGKVFYRHGAGTKPDPSLNVLFAGGPAYSARADYVITTAEVLGSQREWLFDHLLKRLTPSGALMVFMED